MSTKKNNKSSIDGYDHLMIFYKRIFGIFYWLTEIPSSVDSKMNQISNMLKKWSFLCMALNLLCFIRVLKAVYCHSVAKNQNDVNVERVILVNVWSTLISVACYLFHFDSYKKLLVELKCVDKLILKRLSHKINYQPFRNSIICLIVFYLSFILTKVVLLVIYMDRQPTPIWFKLLIFSVKCINIYMQLHAIVLIRLHHFIYEMFGRYVNFAHHLKRSNLLFSSVNNTHRNLRYYKEIHYKLWSIVCELNNVFGLHFIAFFCQRFYEFTGNLSSLLITWEHSNDFWSFRILSMFFELAVKPNFSAATIFLSYENKMKWYSFKVPY